MRLASLLLLLLASAASAETEVQTQGEVRPPPYIIFDMADPEDRLRAIARMQDAARMPSAEEIAAETAKWRADNQSPEALIRRIEESDLSLQEKMNYSMQVQMAEGDSTALAEISRALNIALQ